MSYFNHNQGIPTQAHYSTNGINGGNYSGAPPPSAYSYYSTPAPTPHMQYQPPPQPTSGGSSARLIQPDGFHSSASDPVLQEKYGHIKPTINMAPPPTSIGVHYPPPPSALGGSNMINNNSININSSSNNNNISQNNTNVYTYQSQFPANQSYVAAPPQHASNITPPVYNPGAFNSSFNSSNSLAPPSPHSNPAPAPAPHMQYQPPPQPTSGGSSARLIQPDGFHSSASDPVLQEKYGHIKPTINMAPPPTSIGVHYPPPPSALGGSNMINNNSININSSSNNSSSSFVSYAPQHTTLSSPSNYNSNIAGTVFAPPVPGGVRGANSSFSGPDSSSGLASAGVPHSPFQGYAPPPQAQTHGHEGGFRIGVGVQTFLGEPLNHNAGSSVNPNNITNNTYNVNNNISVNHNNLHNSSNYSRPPSAIPPRK